MQNSDSTIISQFSRIHSLCQDFLRVELNKKGLPNLASSHGYILFLLSKEGELSMQEIAKKINRDKSTTTVLVRKLIELNLVTSTVSKTDSRIKKISLTSLGTEYNRETSEISENLKTLFFSNISDAETKNLENLLNKIENNFN